MITRFLLWLFCACRHRWKIIKQRELAYEDTDQIIGNVIYLQCEKCGDVTRRRLGP